MVDFYHFAIKILAAGYELEFEGLSKGNTTEIKDPSHLKNYINNVTGIKYV
jgi:hypothetical protein